MNDERKTKRQLVAELARLRRRVARLEAQKAKLAQKEDSTSIPGLALYETFHDGIVIVGPSGRIEAYNRAYAEMVGHDREELKGSPYSRLLPRRWRVRHKEIMNETLKRGYSFEFEEEYIRKDGTVFPVSVRSWCLGDKKARTVRIWNVVRDISERKREEEELARYRDRLEAVVEERTADLVKTNQMLTMLSECNQVIVRAQDEADLLQSICRVVTETGGYRLAWIGFAEHDRKKSVRVVAHYGDDKVALDKTRFTWADTPRGRNPTGKAIRTGQTIVCNDLQADPECASWRQEAKRLGLASAIALPLIRDGQVFGALTLYAAKKNAFDAKEARWLTELTADIAYGISALRAQAERKQAEEALADQHALLRTLIDLLPDPIYAKDTQCRKVLANRADLQNMGLETEAEAIGKTDFDTYPEHIAARFYADDRHVIETGQPVIDREEIIITPSGQRWLLTSKVPLRNSAGQVVGLVGAGRDITERKHMEQRQQELIAALRAVVEAADELLAAPSLDSLLRQAIELARERLGLERCAIFLEEGDEMCGTYGTDRHGRTVNEYNNRWPKTEAWMERLIPPPSQSPRWVATEEPLLEWDGEKSVTIGHGWIVTTPIRSARGPIGAMVNDAATTHSPLDPVRQEAVTVFCSLLGSLIEHKKTEEALQKYTERLGILREIDQAILKARSPEEIAQAALDRIQRLVPCQWASLATLDTSLTQATILAAHPESVKPGPGTLISMEPFRPILNLLKEGQCYKIDDLLTFPNPPPIVQEQQALGVRAYAAIPLIAQSTLVGVLSLSSETPAVFDQESLDVAREAADQLTIALQEARLYEEIERYACELEQRVAERTAELERRTMQLQVASEIARDATTALSLDALLDRAVHLIRERFDLYYTAIFLTDEQGEYAVLKAAAGDAAQEMIAQGHMLKIDAASIVGHVASSGQPYTAPDVSADPAYLPHPLLPDTRSEIALPLKAGDQAIGVLNLESDQVAAFRHDDAATLQLLADQLAVAIERTRLFEQTQATLEQRLHTIISNAPIILTTINRQGVITLAEGKGLQPLEFRPGEPIGMSIFQLFQDNPDALETIKKALSGQESSRVIRIGQRIYDTWCAPTRDENGQVTGVVSVSTDITERKQAEEALRQSEERYRTLFESSPEAIMIIGLDGVILDCNEATLNIGGGTVSQEAVIGKPFFSYDDIVSAEEIKRYKELFVQLLEGKDVSPFELQLTLKNGAMRWLEAHPAPLKRDGQVVAVQVIIRDITERKQLEMQVRQQDRLAAIGQLAGGIAHDFNNFLSSIMLYAQLILNKPELPADQARSAGTILDEARQAARLVQQILDFSRRSMIETQPVDLVPAIRGAVEILRRTLPENIRLTLETEAESYIVNADPTRIQQMVMNLAINARDAMPEGGDLLITLSRVHVQKGAEPPTVEEKMPPGDWIRLSIADTGIGMSEKVLAHLFEPFFTTKEPGKGTGLGLAQVYGIVKQHHGYIGVETRQGEGTTFHIYLPVHQAADHGMEKGERPPPPRGKGEIILLVEDEDKVRQAAREALESLGYRVLTAESGRQALEISRSAEQIDLVLTDLIMPEMGGKDLIGELKRECPWLKALAITGYALAEELQSLRELGIVEVIHKPLDVTALAEAIRRALDAGPAA